MNWLKFNKSHFQQCSSPARLSLHWIHSGQYHSGKIEKSTCEKIRRIRNPWYCVFFTYPISHPCKSRTDSHCCFPSNSRSQVGQTLFGLCAFSPANEFEKCIWFNFEIAYSQLVKNLSKHKLKIFDHYTINHCISECMADNVFKCRAMNNFNFTTNCLFSNLILTLQSSPSKDL